MADRRHAASMTVRLVDIADLAQAPIAHNRRHLDADRVSFYAAHLDEVAPVVVFDTGDGGMWTIDIAGGRGRARRGATNRCTARPATRTSI